MSFLSQGSLAARLGLEGAFTWSEAIRIAIKLAGAVEMAHRAGTLHRDIKPENVLMSDYGEPQLADFGIARVEGRFEKATGQFTASIVHAAPEVLDGQPTGVAADVYSLGSTLFSMLAGRPAFRRRSDETLASLLARIVRDPVADLRPRGVPDTVCRVVEQAMSKEAGQRPQSAAEFGRLLQDVQRRAGLPVTDMALVLPPARERSAASPGVAPAHLDEAAEGEETEAPARAAPPSGWHRLGGTKTVVGAALVAAAAGTFLLFVEAGDVEIPRVSGSTVPATAAVSPLPPGGVKVGADPTAVASDPRTGRIYVANSGSLSVSVLDGTTKEVMATIALPSRPYSIALNQRTRRVYVTTAGSAVTVIDTATNSVTASVTMQSRPWGVAVDERANRVYVATSDASITVIDGESNSIATSIPVAARLWAVAVIPETNRVYVTSQESTNLTVIEGMTASVIANIDLGARACGVAANPRTNRVL